MIHTIEDEKRLSEGNTKGFSSYFISGIFWAIFVIAVVIVIGQAIKEHVQSIPGS
ncbi:MAG: hypothetical protein KBB86_01000 [Candidatus Pacebacteria bacterium]|nr:hypothetical protein [Candidatus Paceibacterota bacterium]